jgi:hypothetical protein
MFDVRRSGYLGNFSLQSFSLSPQPKLRSGVFPSADYAFIMKRASKLASPDLRLVALLCAGLTALVHPGLALTLNNPYEPIVGRNVFALRPPTPLTNTSTTPVVAPAGIELQGLTTILGRPQVLLKIKLPPKPPEPAKDQSFVLDIGQREGEVEVVSIDMTAGTVQLMNQGKELALNMKDAAKPAAGAAIPGAIPPPLRAPGMIPSPTPISTAPGSGTSVTTMGGSPTLPPRPSRSNLPGATGMSGGINRPGQDQPVRDLTPEEGAALLEIQRARPENKNLPFPPPRVNLDQ